MAQVLQLLFVMQAIKTWHISSSQSNASDRRLSLALFSGSEGYRLKIESQINETGLLFRLCAVLFKHQWYILKALIQSPDSSSIKDEFILRPLTPDNPVDESVITEMSRDLENLLFENMSVLTYLSQTNRDILIQNKSGTVKSKAHQKNEILIQEIKGFLWIEIKALDRQGLMLKLSQAFYLMGVNIIEAEIETFPNGTVHNRFQVDTLDRRFKHQEFRRRLTEELNQLF